MGSTWKNLISWAVAALVIFLFWSVSSRIQMEERWISYSEFLRQAEAGGVAEVTISGNETGSEVVGTFTNGLAFKTFAPPQAFTLVERMLDLDVEVSARVEESPTWSRVLFNWAPILVVIAFVFLFAKGGSQGKVVEAYQWRLEAKARALQRLASTDRDLTDEEMVACLLGGAKPKKRETEARKALYEMLAERTVIATPEKKYRMKTAPKDAAD